MCIRLWKLGNCQPFPFSCGRQLQTIRSSSAKWFFCLVSEMFLIGIMPNLSKWVQASKQQMASRVSRTSLKSISWPLVTRAWFNIPQPLSNWDKHTNKNTWPDHSEAVMLDREQTPLLKSVFGKNFLAVWQCSLWKDCANWPKLCFCFSIRQPTINWKALPIVHILRACVVSVGREPYIL